MATFTQFHTLKLDILKGVHNFNTGSSTFKLMLTNVAPEQTNDVKADLTEISADGGYTSGGLPLNINALGSYPDGSSGQVARVMADVSDEFIATDDTFPAFRYVVAYNDAVAGKPLVAFWDYGSEVNLKTGEKFTVSLPSGILLESAISAAV